MSYYNNNRDTLLLQYGSEFKQEGTPNLSQTDGIAPQFEMKALNELPIDKSGHIYAPRNWPVRGFMDSHMTYGMYWIFEAITKQDKGFVKRM